MKNVLDFLSRGYTAISQIGLKERYGSRLKQKVILINQLWLAYVIASYSIAVQVFFSTHGFFHFGFFVVFITLSSFTVVLLNWLNKHNTAMITLFLAGFFGLFFLDSMTYGKAGFVMFYFGALISLMFLFSLSSSINILLLVLFMLTCISVNIYTNYSIFGCSDYKNGAIHFSYIINIILSFGVFVYLSFLINNGIVKKERLYYIGLMKERINKENIANKALVEKENLLSELHHRVKNSLAIIASMINMQSEVARENNMQKELQDSKNRIISMSLVHDILYNSSNHSEIDFAEYCLNLNSCIEQNYTPEQRKKLNVEYNVEPTFLNLNEAVPFGLIFNELLNSSYNNSINNINPANMMITLTSNDFIEMVVLYKNTEADLLNADLFETPVKAIINELSNQLNARFKYEYNEGVKFQVRFLKKRNWLYERLEPGLVKRTVQ